MRCSLVKAAREAAAMAYCPYSRFRVGAAVECEDGGIVYGCNVENASYGLTICAERNALFAAIAMGSVPVAIAVSCPDAPPDSPPSSRMPCGACRQVMAEFLPDDAPVYIDGVGTMALGDLIPAAFRL